MRCGEHQRRQDGEKHHDREDETQFDLRTDDADDIMAQELVLVLLRCEEENEVREVATYSLSRRYNLES